MGKLKNRPYKDKATGKIVLEYSHGSQCPHNPQQNASTKIVFSCNPGPDQVCMMLLKLIDCTNIEDVYSFDEFKRKKSMCGT